MLTKAPAIHTNAFSFENADISMRLGLPSTLIRRAFKSETHRFENALEVDQNENEYKYQCGRSKIVENAST